MSIYSGNRKAVAHAAALWPRPVWMAALLILSGLFLVLWQPAASAQEPVSITGITEPIGDVILSATDSGTIATVHIKEGGKVKKGGIVLELDSRLEALEVDRRKLILESKVEREAAATKVATLKTMLDSTRELFDKTGSVSKDELEKIKLEYALALADLNRLEVTEKREGIEYEMALESLNKRRLISPLSGTVIKLFLEPGETCQENQPLVHVVDTSKCLFVGNAEEWVGRRLKKGQSVNLQIKTGSEFADRTGKVVFISPVVDPASGLLEVKAEFDNQDGSVRPGTSGRLILVPAAGN
jgi:RND family efflux transporter MFP subunit